MIVRQKAFGPFSISDKSAEIYISSNMIFMNQLTFFRNWFLIIRISTYNNNVIYCRLSFILPTRFPIERILNWLSPGHKINMATMDDDYRKLHGCYKCRPIVFELQKYLVTHEVFNISSIIILIQNSHMRRYKYNDQNMFS